MTLNIEDTLKTAHTIAVVGLSDNPSRTSHSISAYLQRQGYKIIPVNPMVSEVLGEKSYNSLSDIPEDITIDIVNIFRQSRYLPEIAEESVRRKCGFFWAQQGVYHEKAEQILQQADIPYIMDSCIFVEHRMIAR
ncbi:CoA-binding protein [bacterium]|nr:CoA-binding protein [bacterium]